MNCAILQWVAEQDDLSLHLQGVLLRLGKLADAGGRITLAQTAIAPLIRMGERQARAAIKELVSAKALLRERRGAVGRGRAPDALTFNFERQRDIGGPSPIERDSVDLGEQSPVSPPPRENSDTADIGGLSPVSSQNVDRTDNAAASPVSAIEDAEFVDNLAAPIENASARGNTKPLTTELELNPETDELDFSNNRASASPPKVLNGTARKLPARDLALVVFEQVNSPWLDPNRSHGLATSAGTLAALVAAGADFDLDILPTIKRLMASKREHVRSFGYFETAIRDHAARRKAAEATRDPITALEALGHDQQRTRNHSYASAGRGRARSVETEILMRDIAGDPSEPVR